MYRAIFLDRDGTIIKDKGYIKKISEVDFYPSCFESLYEAQKYFKLFIVSNQEGISRGKITLEEVTEVNNYILYVLQKNKIKIEKIYFCPHTKEENCICRKPKTYFLDLVKEEFSIDLHKSFVIGDHPSDIQLANNSNATGIYVLTGHGRRHIKELEKKIIIKLNLKKAIEYILAKN